MNTVRIRNIEIGSGMPKICVPILGTTKEEILAEAKGFHSIPADIAEWRADWFDGVSDFEQVLDILKELREILADIPLLMTFRTAKEGGEKEISIENYISLNLAAAQSGYVDLIDTELFSGDEVVKTIIGGAHAAGVKVIVSSHDFSSTPEQEEIVCRLRKMQEIGADIPKIAVMPQNKKDVLTLLSATEEMTSKYADRPIITMSMSKTGAISRLCGEVFGSALTFGAAKKASAPGQMDACELRGILEMLHDVL